MKGATWYAPPDSVRSAWLLFFSSVQGQEIVLLVYAVPDDPAGHILIVIGIPEIRPDNGAVEVALQPVQIVSQCRILQNK